MSTQPSPLGVMKKRASASSQVTTMTMVGVYDVQQSTGALIDLND